jgi:hypothetical protein
MRSTLAALALLIVPTAAHAELVYRFTPTYESGPNPLGDPINVYLDLPDSYASGFPGLTRVSGWLQAGDSVTGRWDLWNISTAVGSSNGQVLGIDGVAFNPLFGDGTAMVEFGPHLGDSQSEITLYTVYSIPRWVADGTFTLASVPEPSPVLLAVVALPLCMAAWWFARVR